MAPRKELKQQEALTLSEGTKSVTWAPKDKLLPVTADVFPQTSSSTKNQTTLESIAVLVDNASKSAKDQTMLGKTSTTDSLSAASIPGPTELLQSSMPISTIAISKSEKSMVVI